MKTILFVDYGQDFLEFDVDETGTVIDVRPFQHWVWAGIKVIDHHAIERGDYVQFEREERGRVERKWLAYPVDGVVAHLPN